MTASDRPTERMYGLYPEVAGRPCLCSLTTTKSDCARAQSRLASRFPFRLPAHSCSPSKRERTGNPPSRSRSLWSVTEELAPLERAVLDLLLSRDEEGYQTLRAQAATATVAHREMTGAGFYTDLSVDRTLPTAPRQVGNPLGDGHDFAADAY